MFDALNSSIDEVIILWYRLLLEPYVELALNELHLQVGVPPRQTLVVSEHALALQKGWDSLAPAELETHAE